MKNKISINELVDYGGTLIELQQIIADLIYKYGPDAHIEFDAGYNNVDCYIDK